MQPPGWYHAQGDPPNTTRYWDGSAWNGPAIVSSERQTAGGYDLIPPPETTALVGPAGGRVRAQQGAVSNTRASTAKPGTGRFERLISGGIALLLVGMVLGLCGHNIVTLFSAPAEVQGTVTDFSRSSGGKQTYRIEITSNVGPFYASGQASSFPAQIRNSLEGSRGTLVTVSYSERTGGLIAIKDFDQDRRTLGKFLWPGVAAVATILALAKIYYDFTTFRDGELLLALVVIAFVVGPAAGWAVTGVLDSVLTSLMQAP